MKSAAIPPLRVTPGLRRDAESVLNEGETLSSFVEEAPRKQIELRRFRQEFLARGLAARDRTKDTGHYVSRGEVMSSLRSIRDKAQERR
jgi:hypothetical protein